MYLLAEQPYIKVQREVNSIEQINIEHQRMIYLYDEKIVTQNREFPIEDVMDISYRFIGASGGLLYLHTSKGVFSYTVKTSPEQFVKVYKDHMK
ncbi:hypothetical protein CIL05_03020 [Virgibacillus profundi]|uniref:YokE-like PH domain-containing protein n=1 Tax=Virgibacillus profundi TaxID=2024555 RepID=A0A2A2IK52_9BACI|nr:hypothetical protein [Virgibacillus profundi]PAV31644.1 hypothetical protein CIL05_03020 [Virgibacillus profundi]PXY55830.1 hypothetical protein CIT14_03030 [Virgibacillus profundi]